MSEDKTLSSWWKERHTLAPGPWPSIPDSLLPSKCSQQAQEQAAAGSSNGQQAKAESSIKKETKMSLLFRNVLEHEDGSEVRDWRSGRLNRYQVLASRAHIKLRAWKTQRQTWKERRSQKGKQIRKAENWSQSAFKKIRTEIAARRKLKRSRGWKKYWENQSSEGNQIGFFWYLWFYVENSFLKLTADFIMGNEI